MTNTYKVLSAIDEWRSSSPHRYDPKIIIVSPEMFFELKGEWMRNVDKAYTARRHHSRNEWYITGYRLISSNMAERDEVLIY